MSGRPSRLAVLGLVVGLGLLAALAVVWVATPPPTHLASGCTWWTARPVDQVRPGDEGCFRGVFTPGGGLATSRTDLTGALHMDFPPTLTCMYRPGDQLVIRGQAVTSDGRPLILVEDCR